MKWLDKNFLTIIIVFNQQLSGTSQTGPGGVGNTAGTSNLITWLDANSSIYSDAGTTAVTNGGIVYQWNDLSGYANHATQTTGARRPVWNTNVQNSMPSVAFSSASQYYMQMAITLNPSTTDYSIFVVAYSTENTDTQVLFSQADGAGTGRSLLYRETGTTPYKTFLGAVATASTQNYTPGNWAIIGSKLESNGASSGMTFHQSGAYGGFTTGTFTPESATGNWLIGVNKNLTTQWHNGYISEIVVFDNLANSAQIKIIHNYLAAKYGIALAANDLYTQDDPGSGNFDFDVAGIGRDNASSIHNDAQGTGIVRINNPTGLGDGEFLMWGHDDGDMVVTNTVDVPGGIDARLDRVWRSSETGDVGNVDVSFDLTGQGSVTASDLRLLVDTDNDAVFADETPISGATSEGSNVYKFSGVSAIANGLRFTLGTINVNATPLPITLVSFNAHNIENREVKLVWQTALEINNDYFTVERSLDAINWEAVMSIRGAGNSNNTLDYTATDEMPYKGLSYYRLKQTDFDGKFSYSGVRSVFVSRSADDMIQIYPNPASNEVIITGNEDELKNMALFNTLGQNITAEIFMIKQSVTEYILNLSALNSGVYYIQTAAAAYKLCKY